MTEAIKNSLIGSFVVIEDEGEITNGIVGKIVDIDDTDIPKFVIDFGKGTRNTMERDQFRFLNEMREKATWEHCSNWDFVPNGPDDYDKDVTGEWYRCSHCHSYPLLKYYTQNDDPRYTTCICYPKPDFNFCPYCGAEIEKESKTIPKEVPDSTSGKFYRL